MEPQAIPEVQSHLIFLKCQKEKYCFLQRLGGVIYPLLEEVSSTLQTA